MPNLDALRQLVNDVGADTAAVLLKAFQSDAEKRLGAIEAYLTGGGEVEEVRRHAHSLKGLCGTYGASDAELIARDLETACRGGNDTEIQTLARTALGTIPQDIEATLNALTDV